MAAMVAMIAAIWPSYRKTDVGQLYDSLPDSMQAMFGLQGGEFSGPIFLNLEIMSFTLPIVLIGIAIAAASGTICGETSSGRMDVLLSTGLTRHALVVGRFVGIAMQLLAIVVGTGIVMAISDVVVGFDLAWDHLVVALLLAWLLGSFYAAVGLALACWTGRSGVAIGVTAALAVASWMLSSLGDTVEALHGIAPYFAFHAYSEHQPIVHGTDVGNVVQLAGTTLVAAALAVLGFTRRDV
jgi:ABC-2 type transport system permease protein